MRGAAWKTLRGGCAPVPEPLGEETGESKQAVDTPTCVTIRRGATGDVADAFLSGDPPGGATGSDWRIWSGLSSGGNVNRALLQVERVSITGPDGGTDDIRCLGCQ